MNLRCHKAQIPSTVRLHQATGLAGFVDQEKVAQSTFWAWTTAPNNSWKQKLFTMGNIQHNQHSWKVATSGPQSSNKDGDIEDYHKEEKLNDCIVTKLLTLSNTCDTSNL
jgi:hypothetical protein